MEQINKRGHKSHSFPYLHFSANGKRLSIVDEYTYLGLVFVPSGASSIALSELYNKACRAYFSISNILYTHKKMPVAQALKLADSLVFPVCSYSSEFITPLILPNKSVLSLENLLKSW